MAAPGIAASKKIKKMVEKIQRDVRMNVKPIKIIRNFFDEAEKNMSLQNLSDGTELKLVSYEELKAAKLYSLRPKDTWDITQLARLRTNK